jgi:hypothetical protein
MVSIVVCHLFLLLVMVPVLVLLLGLMLVTTTPPKAATGVTQRRAKSEHHSSYSDLRTISRNIAWVIPTYAARIRAAQAAQDQPAGSASGARQGWHPRARAP